MKRLQVLLATIAVSVGVAFTYYFFELIVRKSTDYVWLDVFNTNSRRWLVVPLCVVLTLIFFGVQHFWDPKSEQKSSEGLGEMPKPTAVNYIKILAIGFLSLLAGASLGPEAILVPSCMLLGAYLGTKVFKKQPSAVKTLAAAGFMALFAAFFNSFIVGVLSLLLITKQTKSKISGMLVVTAIIASLTTILTLKVLHGRDFVQTPVLDWSLSWADMIWLPLLLLGGYGFTYLLKFFHQAGGRLRKQLPLKQWWQHALVAGLGLSVIYLLGGRLIEFTGNEAIRPMLSDAARLGLLGLAWVLVAKTLAIAWSKAIGYRGGLVFPSLFACAVLVALAQYFAPSVSFVFGLIAALVGTIIADQKAKILF